MPTPLPDSREVDRVEAVVTAADEARAEEFLERCVVGSTWRAKIRTAFVAATVVSREPLGTFDERVCTCVGLRLSLPVPIEPRLRFELTADDGSGLVAACIVRPWGG